MCLAIMLSLALAVVGATPITMISLPIVLLLDDSLSRANGLGLPTALVHSWKLD